MSGLIERIVARLTAVEAECKRLASELEAIREARRNARWMTPAEVRAMRRCGQNTVWRAIESGALPSKLRRGRGGKQCRLILDTDARAWSP